METAATITNEIIDGHKCMIANYDGVYCVSLKAKGGPIISSKYKKVAIRNFRDALKLAVAVQKLNHFKRTGTLKTPTP